MSPPFITNETSPGVCFTKEAQQTLSLRVDDERTPFSLLSEVNRHSVMNLDLWFSNRCVSLCGTLASCGPSAILNSYHNYFDFSFSDAFKLGVLV